MNTVQRGTDTRWIENLRIGLRDKFGPVATMLLAVGLTVAIATDGSLPVIWSRALFGVLFVLNVIMIDWLTK